MTNEEIKNRVHSIEQLIEMQRRYEEIQKTYDEKIKKEFGEDLEFPDEYLGIDRSLDFDEDAYWENISNREEEAKKENSIFEKTIKDTRKINTLIKKGSTLEDISKYIEDNQCSIDILHIDYLDCKGQHASLENEFIDYNSEYSYDVWGGYCDLARDLAKKGVEPSELPESILFDLTLMGDYIQAVALIREDEIDRDYKSELLDFVEYLKAKENPKEQFKQSISVQDIANAIQQQELSSDDKEKDDESSR